MSVFKRRFGQKNAPPASLAASHSGEAKIDPPAIPITEQFDAAWYRAVASFGVMTGMGTITLNLEHAQTHQPMLPHEGANATFAQWRQLHAPYDQRRLFFHLLGGAFEKSMTVWQAANFLSADRRPNEALSALERFAPPASDQPDYAEYCAAFAKANIGLTRYAEALDWAQKAADASPDNAHFQTVLADALHLSGKCDAAHKIYSALMAAAPPDDSVPPDAIAEMFRTLFARDTGVVASPVLALEIGESLSDPLQSEQFWKLGETEFFDSPYFRMHYAYHLGKVNAIEQSFAKLCVLVREMPWLREASLNLLRYFEQFDPSGTNLEPEFQRQLRQTIAGNNWTIEGMHKIEIAWTRANLLE